MSFSSVGNTDFPHHRMPLTPTGRLMRYLASEKMVDETGVDVFAANNVTRALGTPQGRSYIDC